MFEIPFKLGKYIKSFIGRNDLRISFFNMPNIRQELTRRSFILRNDSMG
jgi:hypothetical protein